MASKSSAFFLFVLLCSVLWLNPTTAADACIGYSKGAFTGDVTTQDICETACETAEGLPRPDFKIAECTTNNITETLYKCSCRRVDNNGNAVENRDLCEDGPCAGESSGAKSLSSRTSAAVLVAIISSAIAMVTSVF